MGYEPLNPITVPNGACGAEQDFHGLFHVVDLYA